MSSRFLTMAKILVLAQFATVLAASSTGWADTSTAVGALDEGTETHLTAQELASIAEWAKNSQADLKDLLQGVPELSPNQAKEILIHGIRDVVLASAPKTTELLMRYALNRALKVVDTIEQSGHAERPGVVDQEVRVLTRSLQFSLDYYQNDLAYLNSQTSTSTSSGKINLTALPFAKFGGEYARFLMSVNESMINARAQYNIGMMVLGFLQVDLDRDTKKTEFADSIEKIERMRKLWLDTAPVLNSDSIKGMREIYKTYFGVIDSLETHGVIENPEPAPALPPVKTLTVAESEFSGPWQGVDQSVVLGTKEVFSIQDKATYEATIIAKASDGTVTLQFSSPPILGQTSSGWGPEALASRSGCNGGICVGLRTYLVLDDTTAVRVTVIGIQTGDRYVLKFNSGTLHGQIGPGWGIANLAIRTGCSAEGICVDQKMFNPKNNAYCTVVAIQPDDHYVIRYDSGDIKGLFGGGWSKADLAVLQ